MRGNDERRSPAEGASTEAEVSAFEAVLIDPMQEKDEELKDRQFVTALARGLELLRCFTPRESLLGNQELAKKTGLPKPTVSRLTHTLTRLGYLRHLPHSGKYQLEVGVMSFGYAMLSNLSIRALARPLMEEMAGYAKAAVAMAARDRLSMVYLDVVHGEANLTMRRQVGSHLSLHRSAIGQACLAAMPEDEREFILGHIRKRHPEDWPEVRKGWSGPSATMPTTASACRSASGNATSTRWAWPCTMRAMGCWRSIAAGRVSISSARNWRTTSARACCTWSTTSRPPPADRGR